VYSFLMIGGPLDNQELKIPHELHSYVPQVAGRNEPYEAVIVNLFARSFHVLVHTSIMGNGDHLTGALAHALLGRSGYEQWQNATPVPHQEEPPPTLQQDAVR
jgi:hypothetical protein